MTPEEFRNHPITRTCAHVFLREGLVVELGDVAIILPPNNEGLGLAKALRDARYFDKRCIYEAPGLQYVYHEQRKPDVELREVACFHGSDNALRQFRDSWATPPEEEPEEDATTG